VNNTTVKYQWAQLLALSAVHFLVDMFGNMLPSILPEIRARFAIGAAVGFVLLVALTITANGLQMATGHLRARRTSPMFLQLGLVLGVCVCLIGLLPGGRLGVGGLFLLAATGGAGIAIAHPEGLRAVHAIRDIPAAVSTAVFMTGGFLGFALGGVVSAGLVWRFGEAGLYPLLLCPAAGIALIRGLRIRLAVEAPLAVGPASPAMPAKRRLRFGGLWLMAVPAAMSTTLFALMTPSRLEELAFGLTFGGFSATMFGLGGVLGSLVWAAVAARKGELLCSTLAYLLTAPAALAYLLLMDRAWAVWLIFASGFFAFGAYILLVTLARYAVGGSLGFRMGWIVGGTWLLANIVVVPLAPVAERFGTGLVMYYAPLGYALSGLVGLYLVLTRRRQVP